MTKKPPYWSVPGLMIMSHLSVAADVNIIDELSSEPDAIIATESPKQSADDNASQDEPGSDEQTTVIRDGVRKTRFGVGYEYRQSLRPETFERPELPARPQRPERPERPGRFGQ